MAEYKPGENLLSDENKDQTTDEEVTDETTTELEDTPPVNEEQNQPKPRPSYKKWAIGIGILCFFVTIAVVAWKVANRKPEPVSVTCSLSGEITEPVTSIPIIAEKSVKTDYLSVVVTMTNEPIPGKLSPNKGKEFTWIPMSPDALKHPGEYTVDISAVYTDHPIRGSLTFFSVPEKKEDVPPEPIPVPIPTPTPIPVPTGGVDPPWKAQKDAADQAVKDAIGT